MLPDERMVVSLGAFRLWEGAVPIRISCTPGGRESEKVSVVLPSSFGASWEGKL